MNGQSTTYAYDALNRQTKEVWVGQGNTLTSAYDAGGNITRLADGSSTIAYGYDSLDRLTQETTTRADLTLSGTAIPVAMNYRYDAAGNRTLSYVQIGTTYDAFTQYSFDAVNRLTSQTQFSLSSGNAAGLISISGTGNAVVSKRVDEAWDAASRMTLETFYDGLTTSDRVASTSYAYDALDRETGITQVVNTSTPTTITYGYAYFP